ncbi:MAG: helix-turn-helix domain-containing protein [Deltaproteobacteria bacterium]|nr:helix-turn-helix domain-containing protein [Deltaproteobacteria bacterium]
MVAPKTPNRRTLAFTEDVADALNLSETTARRWMSSGRLGPEARFGRNKAVKRKALEAYIEQQFVEPNDLIE